METKDLRYKQVYLDVVSYMGCRKTLLENWNEVSIIEYKISNIALCAFCQSPDIVAFSKMPSWESKFRDAVVPLCCDCLYLHEHQKMFHDVTIFSISRVVSYLPSECNCILNSTQSELMTSFSSIIRFFVEHSVEISNIEDSGIILKDKFNFSKICQWIIEHRFVLERLGEMEFKLD